MNGWMGKVLRVNLTEQDVATQDLDPKLCSSFMGGRGIGTKILFDELEPRINPFDTANKLIFATGPLTGTGAVSGSLCSITSKSPLTSGVSSASLTGNFGAELKFAGYDAIIIEGKSKSPVYLSITDDRARLLPALHLWGRTTAQTERLIRAEPDDIWKSREMHIVSIGPAGENTVNIASVVHENCLPYGGTGMGAVMGAKNLKAISVRGTKGIRVAHGSRFLDNVSHLLSRIQSDPLISEKVRSVGTAFLIETMHRMGVLPVNNFKTTVFNGITNVNSEALANSVLYGHKSCFTCPIGCLKLTEVKGTPSDGRGVGLDYNAIAALGPNLGIDHLPTIAKAYHLCIQLGIDPISMGAAIATATELFEKGKISEEDSGQRLGFGRGKSLLPLIDLVGKGTGFGCILGTGAFHVADGYDHRESFMGVKRREFSPYDPRGIQGLGLHFATSNFGAYHLDGFTVIDEILGIHGDAHPSETEDKASKVRLFQDVTATLNATGICPISLIFIWVEDMVTMVNDALGTSYQVDDLLKIGERIWNLERLFNMKAGLTGADDTMPERMISEPIPDGPSKGGIVQIDKMLPEYYQLRGWDANGTPTGEKLKELALEEMT
jgi:aldehyde:ferredoxin oxidoreductase